MSVRNIKIPLKGYDACLSFSELKHETSEGSTYYTHEIALMGTNGHNEFVFIGEPIQVLNLMDLADILYTVIKLDDWTYFTDQYEIELQPELELIVDNDTD